MEDIQLLQSLVERKIQWFTEQIEDCRKIRQELQAKNYEQMRRQWLVMKSEMEELGLWLNH